MSNDLTPMQTFQERIKDKIRNDIAQMLPDEAIQEMVKRVVEEQFFKETPSVQDGYGRVTKAAQPSWFVQIVRDAARPVIEAAAKQFYDTIAERVKLETETYLRENTLAVAMQTMHHHLSATVSGAVLTGINELANRGAFYHR